MVSEQVLLHLYDAKVFNESLKKIAGESSSFWIISARGSLSLVSNSESSCCTVYVCVHVKKELCMERFCIPYKVKYR